MASGALQTRLAGAREKEGIFDNALFYLRFDYTAETNSWGAITSSFRASGAGREDEE